MRVLSLLAHCSRYLQIRSSAFIELFSIIVMERGGKIHTCRTAIISIDETIGSYGAATIRAT
jgi:hypothetical protein